MNESENNFKDLKNLLKLKRHEVPPPGFFNHFSDGVIARIREGEDRRSASFAAQLNDSAPWLVRFLRIFEAKPGVIGGFATSLCLVLLFGVVLAERSESGPQSPFTASSSPADSMASGAALVPGATPEFASSEGGIVISTNASLQPAATLFGQNGGASSLFQSASFAPAH
ncbi:MAG TPA: hypothetical protein VK815_09505 [Candidatus Acidoferrales bacterium]|jgi:hypothetical protein|nr:hypothetical protein [Candidatus Acidoferrales bacterium]